MAKIFSKKRLVIFGGGLILLLIYFLSRKSPVKVETSKITRGDIIEAVSTSGKIKADEYSELSFQSSGKVAAVYVKVGDKIKRGQAIASLDTTISNSTYQESINTYMSLNAAAQKAEDDVKGHSSDETYTQRSTRMAAQTARDSAYDAMRAAQAALSQATIYAPFDGILDEANPSSPGVNVTLGAANYTVVNPDTTYFDAEVEETDLPKVELGETVSIKLDAYPDQTFQGMVTNIGMVAFTSGTGGNAYHVRISLPKNDNLKFKVGMAGDVDIIYNRITDILKIPSSAVVSDTTNYVWSVAGGKAKKVQVEVGGASLDETEIKSGLSEGETIISQPPANLKNGQKVSI